jgi:MoaA/NifB/PqqE/SkfB family radical SAM enzyme
MNHIMSEPAFEQSIIPFFAIPVIGNRLTDTENKPSAPSALPLKVYFDMTYRCNLTCRHCITASSPYADVSKELSTARILELVDEMAAAGIQQIAVGGGEPFVHPDWQRIFKYITNVGIQLVVTTNGVLLHERNIQALKRVAPAEIRVSFDGGRHFHNSVRGRDNYDKALRGLQASVQNGFNAVARYTYCNGADPELENMFEDIAATGCKSIKIALLKKAGRAKHEPDLMPQSGDAGLAYWLLGLGKKYRLTVQLSSDDFPIDFTDTNDTKLRQAGRSHCGAGFDTAYVSPRGHVLSCVTMPNHSFGQLHYQSFAEAWQSQSAQQFRTKASACGTCRICEQVK